MSESNGARYRWLVLSIFVLSTAINILDRATLAALALPIKQEFGLNNEQYGWITAAFNLTYTVGAPLAGMWLDRFGLNRVITLAVGLWSFAGIATGFTSGLASLVGCRAMLGAAESPGIPAAGKAIHRYLRPGERALGNGVNQAAVSLGQVIAPLLAVWIAAHYGWRRAFIVTGVLGLAWIPVWSWAARRVPAKEPPAQQAGAGAAMLRDRRLWVFMAANALSMMGYYLWFNWTALYLSATHNLTLRQSVWYLWIPPVFAAVGGFAGGGLSLAFIERGMPAPAARLRVCFAAGVVCLATIAIPWAPSPAWSSAGISLSILAIAAFSVNMYTLPLDVFGAAPAGFAISALVSSYGLVSVLLGLTVGRIIDHQGYTPVIEVIAFTPLLACALLWGTRATR